jgi:hypothetical protein
MGIKSKIANKFKNKERSKKAAPQKAQKPFYTKR